MTASLASQFVGLPVCITDFSVFERRSRSPNHHGGAPSGAKKPTSTSSSAQSPSPSVDEKHPHQSNNARKEPVEFRGLLSLPTPKKELIEPWNIYFQFPIVLERKQTNRHQSRSCLDEQD